MCLLRLLRDGVPANWQALRRQIPGPAKAGLYHLSAPITENSCRLLIISFTAGGTGDINARVAARESRVKFGERV